MNRIIISISMGGLRNWKIKKKIWTFLPTDRYVSGNFFLHLQNRKTYLAS